MDPTGGYAGREFVAEFYDHIPLHRERQDVAFYVEAAQRSGGAVLELGCGTGRILLPIARAGIEITGLDLSESMLAVCRQKLSQESAGVQARCRLAYGDMREFDLGRRFQLVTTPFRSFQHLITIEEQASCLRRIHDHLEDGCALILEMFNPSLEFLVQQTLGVEWGDDPEFVLPDGRRVLRRNRIAARDLYQQVQNVELIYYLTHPDGRTQRLVHAFPMRYLFRFEAEHLLARCGFKIEDIYADFDKSPYGSKYPGELIFVARKT